MILDGLARTQERNYNHHDRAVQRGQPQLGGYPDRPDRFVWDRRGSPCRSAARRVGERSELTPTKPAGEKKTIAQDGAKQPDGKAGLPAATTAAPSAAATPSAPATPVAGGVPVRKPGRRAPGAKEVIPFAWKLIGTSGDLTVTLFKAIEKVEVEAQLERLRRDGYYRNLTVLDVDAVVTQPVVAKKSARAKKPSAKTTPSGKASAPAKTSAPSAPAKKKRSPAKTGATVSAAPGKKKSASPKSVLPAKPKTSAKKTSSASATAKPKKKSKPKATASTKKKK